MALLHLEDGQDDVVGSNRLTQQLYYRRDANQSEDRSICVEDGRRIDADKRRTFAQVVSLGVLA